MTPETFIAKWRGVELSERAASQDHINELCELLDLKKPTDDDPTGERFAFEKPVPKAAAISRSSSRATCLPDGEKSATTARQAAADADIARLSNVTAPKRAGLILG